MTTWMRTTEVADRARRHVVTVRKAAEVGDLHGHQRKRKGRWTFTESAVEAWIVGGDSKAACGCALVDSRKRRAS